MQKVNGKEIRDTKGIRAINLGCGSGFNDHLIGVDLYDYGQQIVGIDFETERLPFEDSSIDYIFSHHCLEHIWDVRNVLNECHRILKDSGEFEIYVPYGLWSGASKPVHHQMITESWFDFLRSGSTKVYGYKRWDILKMERTNKTGYPDGAEIHVFLRKKI